MEIEKALKISSSLPLSKKAIINLFYTFGIVKNSLDNVLKPFDLSIPQFNLLRILRGQKQHPVTLETVQERMINKMSNTTRLVDKLTKKNYVKKEINKENRRKINITITDEGLKILETIDILIDNKEKKIISSLSDEETKELIRLLGKIRLIANNSL